jgi:lysophospholipase L1-like esterase
MGNNDAGHSTDTGAVTASQMKTKITNWISDVRLASSKDTEIYLIMGFAMYPSGSNNYYLNFLSGYYTYLDEYPEDQRVYLLYLDNKAHQIMNSMSEDGQHANKTGSALIAGYLYDALTPLAIKNLTGTVDNDTGITLLWEYPEPDTNNITHINTDYLVEYQAS